MKHGALLSGMVLLVGASLAAAQSSLSPTPTLKTSSGPPSATSSSPAQFTTLDSSRAGEGASEPGPTGTSPQRPIIALGTADDLQNPGLLGNGPSGDGHASPPPPVPSAACPACGRCWITPEYMLWTMKKGPLPVPLVTSDPVTILGNSDLDYRESSGGKLQLGTWFDDHAVFGIEGQGFVLGQRTIRSHIASDVAGLPPLNVPFLNADTGLEDILDVSTPGQTVGRVDFSSSSQLWGLESNLICNLFRSCLCSFELLGGLRYLDLKEDINLATSTSPLPRTEVVFGDASFGPPGIINTNDRFAVHNQFYGAQVGARLDFRRGDWFADITGKIAVGATHEGLTVFGSSTLLAGPVPVVTLPGGLLALPSNSGSFGRTDFAAISEVELRVGYQFTRQLSAWVGYNFMYWTSVVRPGDQISHVLSPSQIPTAAEFIPFAGGFQPLPSFRTTDFWAQGVSFGVEYRF